MLQTGKGVVQILSTAVRQQIFGAEGIALDSISGDMDLTLDSIPLLGERWLLPSKSLSFSISRMELKTLLHGQTMGIRHSSWESRLV